MKFLASIDVMPHKEILDPQGKAVKLGLHNLKIDNVDLVRIGKHIDMELEAANNNEATEMVETACKKLLANLVMESYSFSLKEI